MEKKFGDVTYEIKPIPPGLSPYNNLLGEYINNPPQTAEQAEKWQPEIEKALKKVLEACVIPQPPPEFVWHVFQAVQDVTREVLTQAGIFRSDQRSSSYASRTFVRDPRHQTFTDPKPDGT